METKTIVVYADFSSFKSRVNHTIDVTFNVSETSAAETAALFPFLNQQGVLAFKIGDLTDAEIDSLPEPKPEFSNQKSPSERLRNVLFVYFKQQGGDPQDFEAFRVREMEILINSYKNKLSPE
jgi:hypothetical protein